MKNENTEKGKYSYEGLDRVLHEKARLSILTSLFVAGARGCNFNELKKLCALTDGNLSRHIKILKEAGLIEVQKGYADNKPLTTCKLTKKGRESFISYMAELEKVLKDASGEKKSASAATAVSTGKKGRIRLSTA
jgi:DNA-binding MarR family transcriptional regulator